MKELMEFIETAFVSPMNTFITIILFMLAIKGIYESVRWIKTELNNWYNARNVREQLGNTVEKRLDNLEEENRTQFGKLEGIEAALKDITTRLDAITECDRANTVAMCRALLWNWYENVKDRDSINSAEYETIVSLADVYLQNHGNSVFKNKIIPFLKSIPVRD
jgi:hypothetical protein